MSKKKDEIVETRKRAEEAARELKQAEDAQSELKKELAFEEQSLKLDTKLKAK